MMNVSPLLLVILLLAAQILALLLAKYLKRRQEQSLLTLYRLTALERSADQARNVVQALRKMEAPGEVLAPLYAALARDLKRIRKLDVSRTDLDKDIQQAESGQNRTSGGTTDGSVALASERELGAAQRQVHGAVDILNRARKFRQISADDYDNARHALRMLSVNVVVNSCLLMAQRAAEQGDAIKAMGCYRRAESTLFMVSMPSHEKNTKLDMINAERQKLFNAHQDDQGLLLLSGS